MGHFGVIHHPSGALKEGLEPAELAAALGSPGSVGWLDLEGATPDEMRTIGLTALATIGLPFTVISGYFGMNFEWMPWLKQQWGVVAATLLMAGISAGVLLFFRRNDWL